MSTDNTDKNNNLIADLLSRDLHSTNRYLSTHAEGEALQVHRAIMESVLGHQIPEGYVVHHKDHNTQNNDPSNLMLLTEEEHIKLHEQDRLTAVSNKIKVSCYTKDGTLVKTYDSLKDAAADGCDPDAITECLHGRLKTHRNMIWEPADGCVPRAYKKPVIAIDPETGERTQYESVSAAAKECGFSAFNLSAFMRGKYGGHRYYGKVWTYADAFDEKFVDEKIAACKTYDAKNNIPLCAYDTHTGEFVGEYENAEEAAKLVPYSTAPSIRSCCKHPEKPLSSGGLIWRYKSDLTPVVPIYKFVLGIDAATNTPVAVYRSPAAAFYIDGFDSKRIPDCCKDPDKAHKGMKWRYIGPDEIPTDLPKEKIHLEYVSKGRLVELPHQKS